MAIIKKTKSGKGIMVIDDRGTVYITSMTYVANMLQAESSPNRFVLMKRLPLPVAEDRFKKSPIWDPDNVLGKGGYDQVKDAFDGRYQKIKKAQEAYMDKVIDYD
jgi:hypothetical protein